MRLPLFRRPHVPLTADPALGDRIGVRSRAGLERDLAFAWGQWRTRRGFHFDSSTVGFVRPDLSFPALAGLVPRDGLVPIYHLYDRTTGGQRYGQRVTRRTARDYRGGRLSYDDHDGVDLVCPPGSLVVAAAPGVVVAIRDRWLRGGLTVCVDHGQGLVTQVTHCSAALRRPGDIVGRGEPIARSGVTGIDMTISFPWVPPHVHFSVWLAGAVVDPFRASDEPERAGHWSVDNAPVTALAPRASRTRSSRLGDEIERGESPIDPQALERVCASCRDPVIREELARCAGYRPAMAAIIEDALHHERYAFPPELLGTSVRPAGTGHGPDSCALRLTLPLSADDYRGARLADMPWTRPA